MEEKQITTQQRKALHLWFRQMAEALDASGYTVRKTLKPNWDIQWNERLFKELIWRDIQKSMTGKESTTQLTTDEIDKIWDVLNINLAEKFHVHVPFPSLETLENYEKSNTGTNNSNTQ